MKKYSFNILCDDLKSSTVRQLKDKFIELIEKEKETNEIIKNDFIWDVSYSKRENCFNISNFNCSEKRINKEWFNLTEEEKNVNNTYLSILDKAEDTRSRVYLKYPCKLYTSLKHDFYHYDEAIFLYEDAEKTIKKIEKLKKLCDKKIREIKKDSLI